MRRPHKVNLEKLEDDVVNFFVDSRRHKPEGLHIKISCQIASKNDIQQVGLKKERAYLKMVYADNGPGIPEAARRNA